MRIRLLRLGLAFYAALWGVAFVWRHLGQGGSLWLASPESELHLLRHGAFGLAAGAALVAGSSWLTSRFAAGERLARALAEAVGPLRPGQAWILALASGIGEEAFFRGALQPVAGLGLTTLLFALAHFVPRRELWLWSVFAAVAGLLLGGLYELTGSLLAPTVAHVVVNGVNLNRLVRQYGPGSRAPGGGP
ncbi:MAG: CPBP family intramembrane metalloprotease [Deltaproteobacteria bacterium]|nr:CPBP family intramembrane metalloprotease [Deltaproteobacteria bacterium]